MTPRTCPVAGCDQTLGTTRNGAPYLLCPRHYARLAQSNQMLLWRSYGSWRRIERKYMALPAGSRPRALLAARALAISKYVDVRNDCIRKAGDGDIEQLEVAL